MTEATARQESSLRLDKWLWFARVVKTRSLATRLCAAGCVSIGHNGPAKAHHPIRVGDTVSIELRQQRRQMVVRALGTRRGPPAEARLLYDEPTPPISLRAPAEPWISLFDEGDDAFSDQRATHSL